MTAAVLLAAGAGLGLLLLWQQLVPARPDVAAGVRRWDRARQRGGVETTARPSVLQVRIGAKVSDGLSRRGIQWTQLRQDLAITGRTADEFFTRFVLTVVGAAVAPIALTVLAAAVGLVIPAEYVVGACVVAAAGAGLLEYGQVHEAARERRAEFRRALSTYLDLVAMALSAGRGHPEALPEAARIGAGWAFEHLQETILRSRQGGITPWAGLGQLGVDFGIHELEEFGEAMRLVGDDGAKVRDSLTARANTLRTRRLDDEAGQAAQASQSMVFAQIVVGFTFLAYLMYPPITTLFTS